MTKHLWISVSRLSHELVCAQHTAPHHTHTSSKHIVCRCTAARLGICENYLWMGSVRTISDGLRLYGTKSTEQQIEKWQQALWAHTYARERRRQKRFCLSKMCCSRFCFLSATVTIRATRQTIHVTKVVDSKLNEIEYPNSDQFHSLAEASRGSTGRRVVEWER